MRVCGSCKDEQTEDIPAFGHDFGDWRTSRRATCERNGSKKRICNTCQEEEYKTITKLGHSYDEGTVTKAPSCYKKGIMTYVCKNDSSHKYTKDIDPTGKHDYSVLSYDHEGHAYSCSTPGCKAYVSDTHNYSRWKTLRKATEEKTGLKYKICTDCGYKTYKTTYYSTIPETGDGISVIATAMILSTGGLATATVCKKKKKK